MEERKRPLLPKSPPSSEQVRRRVTGGNFQKQGRSLISEEGKRRPRFDPAKSFERASGEFFPTSLLVTEINSRKYHVSFKCIMNGRGKKRKRQRSFSLEKKRDNAGKEERMRAEKTSLALQLENPPNKF